MNFYERLLQKKIEKDLEESGKVIVLYGPRQVGKTTLVKKILEKNPENSFYYNGDSHDIRLFFDYKTADRLPAKLKHLRLLVIDEAQRIENIGLVLKILHDQSPNLKILATGSSSFELANTIKEPLTGRKYEYYLYPFAFSETTFPHDPSKISQNLEHALRFGAYPEIFITDSEAEKQKKLMEITESYLFRDLFAFQDLKKAPLLEQLLQMLALQIGSEVSFQELAQKLQVDQNTIQKYIFLLESAFVIFRLPAFSRNIRKEITKSRKIYFYDLGIRNTLIQNWNVPKIREDIGAIWENFCMVERLKFLQNNGIFKNSYFWRTYDQKEIDLVEESGGALEAFEFKWNPLKKPKLPKLFLETYKNATFSVITPENFFEFILS